MKDFESRFQFIRITETEWNKLLKTMTPEQACKFLNEKHKCQLSVG